MTTRIFTTAFLAVVLLASISTDAGARLVKQRKGVSESRQPVAITGTIDRFIDGDSYWLTRNDGSKVKLREWVEDADEIAHNSKEVDQPFGQAAMKYCTDHWKGKHVTATVKGKSYDRLVVQTIADGETRAIGLDMVSVGLAMVYAKATPRPPQSYKDAEAAAQKAKLGIWKSGSAVAPWDWRKQTRNKKDK